MAKRRRGKPTKYVLGPDGKPIIGLSLDSGNGQYFYSHWRFEKLSQRPNFGTDEITAIIRFREWELRRKNNYADIESDKIEKGGYDVIIPSETDGNIDQDVDQLRKSLSEYKSLDDIPIGSSFEISKFSKIPEEWVWQRARELILKDKIKAQEVLGIRFSVDETTMMGTCQTPLSELLEKFKAQPQYHVGNIPISRKNELNEVSKTWNNFCELIKKKTVGAIIKADILHYYNTTLAQYHKGYSTTWVRKRFYYIKWVLSIARKSYENTRDLEQVRLWCTDLLVPLGMVNKHSAKRITPQELMAILDVSTVMERAIWLLSLNAAYYAVDICSVPLSAFNWTEKVVVFSRNKTGKINRSAVLWDETLSALQCYLNENPHPGKTLFWNPDAKMPYHKDFISHLFKRVLKKAIEKQKEEKTQLVIDKELVHSNFRDSFRTTCEIKGNGIEGSALAVMGHKPNNKISVHYIDPRAYPQIAADACKAVHDSYFSPEIQKTVQDAGNLNIGEQKTQ